MLFVFITFTPYFLEVWLSRQQLLHIGLKYIKHAQFFIDDRFWEEMTCEWALLGVLSLINRLIVQLYILPTVPQVPCMCIDCVRSVMKAF